MEIKLTVVIPTLIAKTNLDSLINNLKSQVFLGHYEIIIVENPSTLNTTVIEKTEKYTILRTGAKKGANHARNKGATIARGSTLLFLDDDCHPSNSSFLQKHLEYHHQNPEHSVVAGPYQLIERSKKSSFIYHLIQTSWILSGLGPNKECSNFLGGNCSFKRDFFNDLKFDENLIFGGTESELQARALKAGKKFVWCEDLEVIHRSDLDLNHFIRKGFLQGLGSAYIEKKGNIKQQYISLQKNSILSYLAQHLHYHLYRASFDVGYKYFKKTSRLTCPTWHIYRLLIPSIIAEVLLKHPAWLLEIKNLTKVIRLKSFSEKTPYSPLNSRNPRI